MQTYDPLINKSDADPISLLYVVDGICETVTKGINCLRLGIHVSSL